MRPGFSGDGGLDQKHSVSSQTGRRIDTEVRSRVPRFPAAGLDRAPGARREPLPIGRDQVLPLPLPRWLPCI